MPNKLRQLLVSTIIALWPIMPTRFKVWAFMNDEDLDVWKKT